MRGCFAKCSFGTWVPGRYTEVTFIQGWPLRGAPLYQLYRTAIEFLQYQNGPHLRVQFLLVWFPYILHSGPPYISGLYHTLWGVCVWCVCVRCVCEVCVCVGVWWGVCEVWDVCVCDVCVCVWGVGHWLTDSFFLISSTTVTALVTWFPLADMTTPSGDSCIGNSLYQGCVFYDILGLHTSYFWHFP